MLGRTRPTPAGWSIVLGIARGRARPRARPSLRVDRLAAVRSAAAEELVTPIESSSADELRPAGPAIVDHRDGQDASCRP